MRGWGWVGGGGWVPLADPRPPPPPTPTLASHPPYPTMQAEDLLREALVLQTALDRGVAAGVLERLLPKRFKQYSKGISGRA